MMKPSFGWTLRFWFRDGDDVTFRRMPDEIDGGKRVLTMNVDKWLDIGAPKLIAVSVVAADGDAAGALLDAMYPEED